MPTLKIACKAADVLSYKRMKPFQGGLKSLSRENYHKLRAHLEVGYSFATHIWVSPEGHNFILDGHQRLRVIKRMAKDGWTIPPLPVVYVEAGSYGEAKTKLLGGASQFGTVEDEPLNEFIVEADISVDDLIAMSHFHEIDFGRFKASNYEDEKKEKTPKAKTCPHCGSEL